MTEIVTMFTQADYPLNEQRWLVTNTTDIVLDMSYRNLSQFRLMTHFLGFLQEESTSGLLNMYVCVNSFEKKKVFREL